MRIKLILIATLACFVEQVTAVDLPDHPPTNLVLNVMFTSPDRPAVSFRMQASGKASLSGVIPTSPPDRVNVTTNLSKAAMTQFYSTAKQTIDTAVLPLPQPPHDNTTGVILTSGGFTISVSGKTSDRIFDPLFEKLRLIFPREMKALKPQQSNAG